MNPPASYTHLTLSPGPLQSLQVWADDISEAAVTNTSNGLSVLFLEKKQQLQLLKSIESLRNKPMISNSQTHLNNLPPARHWKQVKTLYAYSSLHKSLKAESEGQKGRYEKRLPTGESPKLPYDPFSGISAPPD